MTQKKKTKKVPSKKKPSGRKPKPAKPEYEAPMSTGFGHLTIPEDALVKGDSTVDGGEPDWEGWSE